jgi:hypothetical protein
MSYQIPVTPQLVNHLQWWLHRPNMLKGRSLQHWSTDLTITTDASKVGYGGHMNNQIYQGIWSQTEALRHINILEMEAVIRTVRHFLPHLKNKKCTNQIRQHHSSTVYKSPGRKQIPKSLLPNMGFMASGYGTQFQSQGSLCYGLSEHFRRPLIPGKNPSIRMDSKQSGNKQTVQHLGYPNRRSVCIQRQS